MEPFETFEVEGLTVELHYDEDGGYANPRDCDGNLGIMVCWHPDYVLGDEQIRDAAGRGAIGGGDKLRNGTTTPSTEHEHSGRFSSIGALARWARLAEESPVVLPLYLYDHSGITMSAGAGLVVGETRKGGYDEFGSPRGWDTTLCGVIYTTAERWLKWMGEPLPADPAKVKAALRSEVALYAAYLEGRVYGYVVRDADGETLDSCWGFLADVDDSAGLLRGGGHDETATVRAEATDAAKAHAAAAREKAAQVGRAWASLWLARGFAAVAP